jgi:hypothetical protein
MRALLEIMAILTLAAGVMLLWLLPREVRKEDGRTSVAAQEPNAAPTQSTTLPASPATGSTEPDTAASEDSGGPTRTNTTAKPETTQALISPSGLEISLVKQTTGRVSGAKTLTLPIATTAGNALVAAIAVKAGSSVSVTRVADSTGATWRKGAVGFLTGSNTRSELWYRVASSAVRKVTVTLSASNMVAANVSEWTGVATAAALDAAGGAGNASSTTAATPSIATTQPGDLVIGAVNYSGSATSTLSAGGLTALKSFSVSSTVNGRAAYRVASAAGSYRATWTLSASAASGGTAIALKPALPRHIRQGARDPS